MTLCAIGLGRDLQPHQRLSSEVQETRKTPAAVGKMMVFVFPGASVQP